VLSGQGLGLVLLAMLCGAVLDNRCRPTRCAALIIASIAVPDVAFMLTDHMNQEKEASMMLRNWRWWTLALRGLAAVLFGLLSLLVPHVTVLSVVLLFGVYAIVDGVLALTMVRRSKSRLALVSRGAVSMLAGVLAIGLPGISAFALILVIASWAIASGVVEIVTAIQLPKEVRGEWLLAVEGVLSIVFGGLLFLSPLAGAIVIGLWVGAYALVLGGMFISTAFHVRSWLRDESAAV
jgi:uncharacterized membrane protein HdeD (DUF308 family)